MQNGILNTKSPNEDGDWTLSSFENPLTDVRWGLRKPITDIDVIQSRAYTIEEKVLIDACEAKYPEVSHSPLGRILYGDPYYKGFFPACLDPITHLKGDVKKHVLCQDRVSVDEGNLAQVQSFMEYLKTNKMIKDREKNVVDQWVKTTLIEQRPPAKILSDLVLTAKLHASSAEYKDWIAVSKSLTFPWNLLFSIIYYFAMVICHHCAYTACTRIESTVLKLHKQIT